MHNYTNTTSNHRHDIDGLRAIAVLSVVLFHIKESLLPGGFIGVDIFFVISGYLITQQILTKLAASTFCWSDFYRKRILRLFPAMFAVVVATVTVSQFVLTPDKASSAAYSGVSALLSATNLYFWKFQDTSYFATSSLELPLLHLWSLGVEEQFYMVWPLVLVLFHRHHIVMLITMLAMMIVSFGWAHTAFLSDPSESYYMLHCRAGELIVGGVAALIHLRHPKTSFFIDKHSATFRGVGLIALLVCFITYDGQMHFPGISVLPPVIASAFIILARGHSQDRLYSLLTRKPLVFFGVISYSMYLWHWPVMAFYHYGNQPIGVIQIIVLFLVISLLGWMSYRWIETPFRYSSASTRHVLTHTFILPLGVAGGLFLVFAMCLGGQGPRYYQSDYTTSIQKAESKALPASKDPHICQVSRLSEHPNLLKDPRCLSQDEGFSTPSGDTPPTPILMFGDSNAAHYVNVFDALASSKGISIRNIAIGACPPLYTNFERYARSNRVAHCQYALPKIWEEAKNYPLLIISASWLAYQNKDPTFIDEFFRQMNVHVKPSQRVLLVGNAPVFKRYDRECQKKAISFPFMNCAHEPEPLNAGVIAVNSKIQDLVARHGNYQYVDFNDVLCANHQCKLTSSNGTLLYFDASHLSQEGIAWVAQSISKNNFYHIKEKIFDFFNLLY